MATPDEADTLDMPVDDGSAGLLANAATLVLPQSSEQLRTSAPAVEQLPAQPAQAASQSVDPKVVAAARTAYAKHHGVPPEGVTMAQLESNEGIFHWASLGQDVSARGPAGQALKRALKWRPDMQASYNILLDSMKQEFRKGWCATRNFDFVEYKRTTSSSFLRRRDEVGKFVTRLQLESLLGGSDKPEACAQAANYISMCEREDLKDLCCFNDVPENGSN